jgi:hypothetical protein
MILMEIARKSVWESWISSMQDGSQETSTIKLRKSKILWISMSKQPRLSLSSSIKRGKRLINEKLLLFKKVKKD